MTSGRVETTTQRRLAGLLARTLTIACITIDQLHQVLVPASFPCVYNIFHQSVSRQSVRASQVRLSCQKRLEFQEAKTLSFKSCRLMRSSEVRVSVLLAAGSDAIRWTVSMRWTVWNLFSLFARMNDVCKLSYNKTFVICSLWVTLYIYRAIVWLTQACVLNQRSQSSVYS